MSALRMDLNCDLGEGCGRDAGIMPFITSANIACGGHAGDPATMRATVALARHHAVAIGAHPGFADREHFGRRELRPAEADLRQLIEQQIRALQTIAPVRHVKLHGALYTLAARDELVAGAVAEAVASVDSGLILVGLAGSALLAAGLACGLRVASEAFVDRSYAPGGGLTPRGRPDAMISSEDAAIQQALMLAKEGRVRATDGSWLEICADTLCIHGDETAAPAIARKLRAALEAAGITVAPLES